MGKIIECGELTVNANFRLPITKFCKAHDIKEGDIVRVTIEKMGDTEEGEQGMSEAVTSVVEQKYLAYNNLDELIEKARFATDFYAVELKCVVNSTRISRCRDYYKEFIMAFNVLNSALNYNYVKQVVEEEKGSKRAWAKVARNPSDFNKKLEKVSRTPLPHDTSKARVVVNYALNVYFDYKSYLLSDADYAEIS